LQSSTAQGFAVAQGLHGLQGLQGSHNAAQGLHGLSPIAAQGLQGLQSKAEHGVVWSPVELLKAPGLLESSVLEAPTASACATLVESAATAAVARTSFFMI
jgi:hypothetical protein